MTSSSGQLSSDADIAAFAESIELAAVDTYEFAKGRLTTAEVITAADEFIDHHHQHAVAYAATAGRAATGRANPKLVELLGGQLLAAADENETLAVLFGLENSLAATYLAALGAFEARSARALTASVLPVEAQHGAVLGIALDSELETVFPSFETTDRAFDPDDFPVAE